MLRTHNASNFNPAHFSLIIPPMHVLSPTGSTIGNLTGRWIL